MCPDTRLLFSICQITINLKKDVPLQPNIYTNTIKNTISKFTAEFIIKQRMAKKDE